MFHVETKSFSSSQACVAKTAKLKNNGVRPRRGRAILFAVLAYVPLLEHFHLLGGIRACRTFHQLTNKRQYLMGVLCGNFHLLKPVQEFYVAQVHGNQPYIISGVILLHRLDNTSLSS